MIKYKSSRYGKLLFGGKCLLKHSTALKWCSSFFLMNKLGQTVDNEDALIVQDTNLWNINTKSILKSC